MRTDQTSTELSKDESLALKKEHAYIRNLLGVEEEESDSASETLASVPDDYMSSCDEVEVELGNKPKTKCVGRATSVMSSDGGYISSSDEERGHEKINKCNAAVIDVNVDNNTHVVNEVIEKFNLQNLPLDLKQLLPGINQGLPKDYNVPIDKKPDWLDMKKLKIGQAFAQKYFFGLNYSDMLSLIILFAFPDALEPLIYTKNSGTPFTAFRRYLSTVLRVTSWYDHDIWNKDNLGYRNLRTVRALHLNVSKRLNSTPNEDLKKDMTLSGSPVWSTMKDSLQEDFQSACPFRMSRPIDHTRPDKLFVSQLDMSITQFGFVGLMVTYPEKFGAANATKEELEGFVHLWRGIGYLLGIEDEYNFCAGTFEEVIQRCHHMVESWVKPSFQNITEDWEHMSRVLVEGLSYYVPLTTFEVTLMYLCWVLDMPAPRLKASLTWGQTIVFSLVKFTMTVTLRVPGMLPLHNWLLRKALARASSMNPEELKKLENKKYDYETKGDFVTRL